MFEKVSHLSTDDSLSEAFGESFDLDMQVSNF